MLNKNIRLTCVLYPPFAMDKGPEERLREVESEIKEVLDLMAAGLDRNESTADVGRKRKQRDEWKGSQKGVFMKHAGANVSTTMHSKAHLELGDALKHRLRLGRQALKLEEALARLVEERVALLEGLVGGEK